MQIKVYTNIFVHMNILIWIPHMMCSSLYYIAWSVCLCLICYTIIYILGCYAHIHIHLVIVAIFAFFWKFLVVFVFFSLYICYYWFYYAAAAAAKINHFCFENFFFHLSGLHLFNNNIIPTITSMTCVRTHRFRIFDKNSFKE